MKPLLKWAGGKSWAVKLFGDVLFGLDIKDYYEPFLGGAAMALRIAENPSHQKLVVSDVEKSLMQTYAAVRDMPSEVALALKDLTDFGTDESAYYAIRDTEPDEFVMGAARFIYLNKLCFNGIHRVNKSGKFNVPYGKNPDRELPGEKTLVQFSEWTEQAEFHCKDFAEIISRAGKGDLVYTDPPYDGTFTDYAAGGFTDADQERLAESLFWAHDRGARVVLHNADTEQVRYFYEEWLTVLLVDEKRSINVVGSKRGGVPCVIATNVPELIEFFDAPDIHKKSRSCG